jgi:hypothetical protein
LSASGASEDFLSQRKDVAFLFAITVEGGPRK